MAAHHEARASCLNRMGCRSVVAGRGAWLRADRGCKPGERRTWGSDPLCPAGGPVVASCQGSPCAVRRGSCGRRTSGPRPLADRVGRHGLPGSAACGAGTASSQRPDLGCRFRPAAVAGIHRTRDRWCPEPPWPASLHRARGCLCFLRRERISASRAGQGSHHHGPGGVGGHLGRRGTRRHLHRLGHRSELRPIARSARADILADFAASAPSGRRAVTRALRRPWPGDDRACPCRSRPPCRA